MDSLKATRYFENGRAYENERIVKYIKERIDDFKACSKNDCCPDHIYVLEGILEDINEMARRA